MFAKYTIFVKIAPLMHSPLLAGFHYFHHINLPISSKSPLFKGPLLASKLNICQIGHGEFLPDSPFSSGPIRHFVNFSTSQAAPLVIYLNFHQPASGDYFFLPDSSLRARISGLYCGPYVMRLMLWPPIQFN